MPALEVTDLRQYACLWAFVQQDRHGRPVVSPPVEIKVRWVLNDSQIVDPTGNTIASSGTLIASRDIHPMSLLRLGRLKDLPNAPDKLHTCTINNTTPDIKNRNTRFDYNLMRYSDLLPTVQP